MSPRKIKILTMVIPIMSLIFIFLALFYIGDDLGLPTDVHIDFLSILPGLFLFAVGILIVAKIGGLFIIPALTLIGIGLAILAEEMYDLGILNDAMISNLTIDEYQILIIAVMFLVGVVATGVRLKK